MFSCVRALGLFCMIHRPGYQSSLWKGPTQFGLKGVAVSSSWKDTAVGWSPFTVVPFKSSSVLAGPNHPSSWTTATT